MKLKYKIIIILAIVFLTMICAVIVHFALIRMDYENFQLKNYYYDMMNIVASDSEN